MGTLGNCPIPDEGVTCVAVHEPYRCGADSCNYSNDCLARAANYNITEDCVKVNNNDILSGINSSAPTTSYATVNDVDNIPTSVPSNNDRSYSTNLKISRLSFIIGFFAWSLFLF